MLGMLEFITLATSLVTIRSPETGLFLSMHRSGSIYASPILTADAIFYEHIEPSHFTTFTSVKHAKRNRDCLLSINRRGVVKKSCRKRRRARRATNFVTIAVWQKKSVETLVKFEPRTDVLFVGLLWINVIDLIISEGDKFGPGKAALQAYCSRFMSVFTTNMSV